MGQIKNIKLHIVTDIKNFSMEVDETTNEAPIDEPEPTAPLVEETSDQKEEKNVVKKEDIAVARERFLRLLLSMQNKTIHFNMYQNTSVSATFQGADSGMEQIAVSQLITPIAVYDTALIRSSDLLSFSVEM